MMEWNELNSKAESHKDLVPKGWQQLGIYKGLLGVHKSKMRASLL